MTSSNRCRAKDKSTCRVHGTFTFPEHSLDFAAHAQVSAQLSKILSDPEFEALSGYLKHDYTEINGHLHGTGGVPETHPAIKRIPKMDKALKKLRKNVTPKERILYRATKAFQDFKSREEASEWVTKKFPVGSTVSMPGFTSTTPNPKALFDFLPESHADRDVIEKELSPERKKKWEKFKSRNTDRGLGNIIFVVKGKTGIPVSEYGQTYAKKEQEYLYPRNTEFLVEDVLPYRKVVNPDEYDRGRRPHAHATVITLREV